MSIISIFRQSKSHQKSSFNHLFSCNEITNQNSSFNKNLNEKNIVITLNEDNDFVTYNFSRNEENKLLKKRIEARSEFLDREAREAYQNHKINEKLELEKIGIHKKIRTVLQSKKEQLRKEFLICFGNTNRDELIKHFKSPSELANACLKGSIAILNKKGLSKQNLISFVLHMDEAGLPHCHVIYNDYSFEKNTTATQIAIKKHSDKDKKSQYKLRILEFSEYQDLLANEMQLTRGEKGSRRKHLDIQNYKNLKESEDATKLTKKSIFKSATYLRQQQRQKDLTIK